APAGDGDAGARVADGARKDRALDEDVGVAVTGGRFEMRASIVRDAIALGSPGAGLFASDTEISLDRCAFERNEVLGSREGGGIALQTSTLVARDTAFIRNKSEVGAGLDVGSGSTATLDGCIFDGNRSQFAGAAVSSVAGSAVIRDTVVVGNDSDGQSSGSIIEGFGRLERCTVFGNVAGSPAVAGGFDVVASIAWRNLPSDVTTTGAVRDSLIGTLDAASETVGVLQSDPRFWGTSELTLRPSSPAIDALPESYGLDADGSRREMGARPFDPAACGPDCDGRVGELGCTAQPNATGATAILGALGSLDLGTDRLALTGQGFPPRQPAVVLAGTQEGTFPLLGESTVLCLGAPFVRAIPEGLTTRPDGSFAADLPLGEAPFAGSAGATWRCQVWFRDPVFGTGLSNSLVLTVR
ncbi:MAG: right-handed parallel beta-helix repeat-containing protein, partial [Planctomycetota bacterium]